MKKISFDDLNNQVCVITGGAGVIGTAIVKGLTSVGIKTAILDINKEMADKVAAEVEKESGVTCKGYVADVLNKESLEAAKKQINADLGKVNLLINGAGGNSPKATTQLERLEKQNLKELEKSFFGLAMEGFKWVFNQIGRAHV